MELNARSQGNVTILYLGGRFDAYETTPIAEWLKSIAAVSPANIAINMTDVKFIDSTGLATLVQGMKYCQSNKGNLHLCCLQQPVRTIFNLTRLDKAIAIFNTEQDAINGFTL